MERAAEFAASTSIAVRNLLPCRVPAGVRLPADSCAAGATPAHAANCSADPNRDMSPPVSAMNTCEVITPGPGDRAQQLELVVPRRHPRDDLRIELAQRHLGVLQTGQQRPHQQRMMLIEPPRERLSQVGEPAAHPVTGEVLHHHRAPLPGDQRAEHGPRGPTGDVRRHHRQLDRGVLQQLLQPARVTRAVPHHLQAVAGQVAQLTDLRRRHKRRTQQPMLEQLGDPLRVLHIGLATRHRLHVSGVEQPALHPLTLLRAHKLAPDCATTSAGRPRHSHSPDPASDRPRALLTRE